MLPAAKQIVLFGGPTRTGVWTPSNLAAALKAWWSADDHGTANMTDDGGGLISNWIDKVSGTLAITATTTARPTWSAAAFNSAYAGLSFDAVANCLVATSFASLPTSSTPGEIWMSVDQQQASGVASGAILVYGGLTNGIFRRLLCVNNPDGKLHVGDGTGSVSDTLVDFRGLHVIGGIFDINAVGRIDGRNTNPAAAAVTLNTSTTRFRIGANNAATAVSFWLGVVRHCIVTLALTPMERLRLEGWLAWDGGVQSLLPYNHPFRNGRP